ncbi:hypothetical protein ASG01_08520 [Chryseobacterium sp. Leaf180]|uniref:DUF4252 domain-containing protein n=1 Tax=Chryseobacterium sp. Leaf180 TaxID=1736289 RepID=UPI0006FFA3F9|nr:DUF4252 domain-containing protein [Chryseobacterium sp. Leaf180]KQR93893.1 hypothetical protein ASG01_08520 [Chryseobacterium sp. Leaf180]
MKTLKILTISFCLIFLLQSCIVSEKPNMAFFAKTEQNLNGAKFTSINVPLFMAKPFIKKALRQDGESEEVIAMIRKISKIKIMTVENGSKAMIDEYASYLTDEKFEDWATIKHNGDKINLQVKQTGENIKNLMLTVDSGKELVFIDIKGKFTPKDISDFINSASDK